MRKGFEDGLYAAVPYGKSQLIVIYNGEQLEVVSTPKQARDFVANHKTDTSESPETQKSPMMKSNKKIENESRRKRTSSEPTRTKVGHRTSKAKNTTSSTRKKRSLS